MAGGGRTVVAKSSRSKAARTYVFVKVNAGKTCSEMESSEIFFFLIISSVEVEEAAPTWQRSIA